MCLESLNLGVTTPYAVIITGTTLHFTLHICSNSFFSPWYFSVFLILLPYDITIIWDCHNCCLLLFVNHHDVWLVTSSCSSVWNLKSPRILVLLLSTTFELVSHWEMGSFNLTLGPLSQLEYTVPACILHPVRSTGFWTASGAPLHSLKV